MIRPALITSLNLLDDLIVARENDRRMSKPAGMIHVYAYLERLIDRFRPIDREHREQLLDRQRMFAAYALNRRNQEFGVRLDRKTDQAGDIGGLLADCHGLHEPRLGIDHRAPSSSVSFSLQMCAPRSANFFSTDVINLIVDHHRLL